MGKSGTNPLWLASKYYGATKPQNYFYSWSWCELDGISYVLFKFYNVQVLYFEILCDVWYCCMYDIAACMILLYVWYCCMYDIAVCICYNPEPKRHTLGTLIKGLTLKLGTLGLGHPFEEHVWSTHTHHCLWLGAHLEDKADLGSVKETQCPKCTISVLLLALGSCLLLVPTFVL